MLYGDTCDSILCALDIRGLFIQWLLLHVPFAAAVMLANRKNDSIQVSHIARPLDRSHSWIDHPIQGDSDSMLRPVMVSEVLVDLT